MAEKRCFTKKITQSDAFLDMPMSTQCLYFHLNMEADDDGFVNSPKRIAKMIGASEDDLKILIAKSFLILFESGVIVIKHFRLHNTLRNDRYHPTSYQEEYAQLGLKDNGSYTLATTWQPNGNQLETEHNITKHNITKNNYIDETKMGQCPPQQKKFKQPTIEEVTEYCKERGNRIDAEYFINYYSSKGWMIGKNHMKDWKAAVRTWEIKDGYKPPKKVEEETFDEEELHRMQQELLKEFNK